MQATVAEKPKSLDPDAQERARLTELFVTQGSELTHLLMKLPELLNLKHDGPEEGVGEARTQPMSAQFKLGSRSCWFQADLGSCRSGESWDHAALSATQDGVTHGVRYNPDSRHLWVEVNRRTLHDGNIRGGGLEEKVDVNMLRKACEIVQTFKDQLDIWMSGYSEAAGKLSKGLRSLCDSTEQSTQVLQS